MGLNFRILVKDFWILGNPYVQPNYADIGLICKETNYSHKDSHNS